MRLKGETAVITGGASGIGAACVRRLLEEGAAGAALDLNPKPIEGAFSLACDVDLRISYCGLPSESRQNWVRPPSW